MIDSTFPRLRFHKADGSHRRPDDTDTTSKGVSKKLAARRHSFDATRSEGGGRKPTDRLFAMQSGKNRMFHRPGSSK